MLHHLAGTHLVAALNPLSSTSLLASLGALGVFVVLFAETGLLIGFFLPGDSLLVTAGLLCAGSSTGQVHLSLPLVLLAAAGGALLGAQTGFLIGRKAGRRLLDRTRNRFVRDGMQRSEHILARYGHGKAIVLGRFIPIVRTVVNPMAGALDLSARTFTDLAGRGRADLVNRPPAGRVRAWVKPRARRRVPIADHCRHRGCVVRADRHRGRSDQEAKRSRPGAARESAQDGRSCGSRQGRGTEERALRPTGVSRRSCTAGRPCQLPACRSSVTCC